MAEGVAGVGGGTTAPDTTDGGASLRATVGSECGGASDDCTIDAGPAVSLPLSATTKRATTHAPTRSHPNRRGRLRGSGSSSVMSTNGSRSAATGGRSAPDRVAIVRPPGPPESRVTAVPGTLDTRPVSVTGTTTGASATGRAATCGGSLRRKPLDGGAAGSSPANVPLRRALLVGRSLRVVGMGRRLSISPFTAIIPAVCVAKTARSADARARTGASGSRSSAISAAV